MEELGEMLITPHDYQSEAFTEVFRTFGKGAKSALVVMPTGTGKTVLFLMCARCAIEEGGRVLILAHTDELINQACNSASPIGLKPTIEKAEDHARPDFTLGREAGGLFGEDPLDPKLVVASVATMRGRRLQAWPSGHFDLIITDEAHHAAAGTYRDIIRHLRPKWHLGVTATPDRADGEPILGEGQVFERLAFEYPLLEAVQKAQLKKPIFELVDCEVDLKHLRIKKSEDYNAADIEAALLPHVKEIVHALRPKLEGKRAIIFTPMIASASAVASAFNSLGVSTGFVYGDAPDRDEVIADFKNDRYQHIANAMMLGEGVDFPFVDTSVILRLTASRGLFVQMIGRCLRKFAGKPTGTIMTVDWKLFESHKLVHPIEIFNESGKADPGVVKAAKELVDSGEVSDLEAAMKRAVGIHREREAIRIKLEDEKRKERRSTRWCPLDMDGREIAAAPKWNASEAALQTRATDRQLETLVSMGFKPKEVSEWTKARASGVIGEQRERRQAGLSSLKQQRYLKYLKCPNGHSMTFAEASAEIDRRVNVARASA